MHKSGLHHVEQSVDHVYFRERGLVAELADTENGSRGVESRLEGYKGSAGHPVALGPKTSRHCRIVQALGHTLRLPSSVLMQAMEDQPDVREVFLRYA